jgi:hypothetical protein
MFEAARARLVRRKGLFELLGLNPTELIEKGIQFEKVDAIKVTTRML